jgi:predicted glycosyltransferase
LPAVKAGATGFSSLEDEHGRPVDDDFKARRTAMLLDAFRSYRPDVLLIEAFPFGRRAMRFELLPLLELANALPRRPLIAASVRDILQETTKPGRAEETLETIERYFDLVLVHGDPSFARLDESFPLADAITREVFYTGLVAGPPPAPASLRFDVLISAGGGAAGLPLIRAAADMLTKPGHAYHCGIVTGPNLPRTELDSLLARKTSGLEVFAFRPDLPDLMGASKLSISQAGYNTVCDVLRAGCRSLLVPFAAGGETEQSVRAKRLETMGLAAVLPEASVTADQLQSKVRDLLAQPVPQTSRLDLEGARHTAERLLARLGA